jgi:hypothetical protein
MQHQPEQNTNEKGELLGKMLVLATNAHSGQFDKGVIPIFYIRLR